MGMTDDAFFMTKHTSLPNRNHSISSPICPMGVADTLGQGQLQEWTEHCLTAILKKNIKVSLNLTFTMRHRSNVSATPIGQTGLEMGWFPLGNGVCLIMKKAPSDSPIWQLKKRELLLPLSFLITKPLKLDLSNLHYKPHYKPHYRAKGCVIRENNITTPLQTPLRTPLRIL